MVINAESVISKCRALARSGEIRDLWNFIPQKTLLGKIFCHEH